MRALDPVGNIRVHSASIGGIVLQSANACWFVPAEVALHVHPIGQITAVPGAPEVVLGVTLLESEVVAVMRLGAGASRWLLLCEHAGQRMALSGFEHATSGWFQPNLGAPAHAPAVFWRQISVPILPIAEWFTTLQTVTSPRAENCP